MARFRSAACSWAESWAKPSEQASSAPPSRAAQPKRNRTCARRDIRVLFLKREADLQAQGIDRRLLPQEGAVILQLVRDRLARIKAHADRRALPQFDVRKNRFCIGGVHILIAKIRPVGT